MPVTALVTPGPRGDQRHADLAGGARVAVGGVHGGLLVAHQHVLDRVLLVQRVVDVEHRAAGVAPEVLDAFGLQAADEDFRAVRARAVGGRAACADAARLTSAADMSMLEPLRISLTKNHRCPSSRPREADVGSLRGRNADARVGRSGSRPVELVVRSSIMPPLRTPRAAAVRARRDEIIRARLRAGPLPRRRQPLATDKELSDFLKSVEKRAFKRTVYAVRDEDAALDIVQDAMIRLAEKYADRPAAELPLLFQRILSNATMDWFRRQKVRNAVVQNFSDFEVRRRGRRFRPAGGAGGRGRHAGHRERRRRGVAGADPAG